MDVTAAPAIVTPLGRDRARGRSARRAVLACAAGVLLILPYQPFALSALGWVALVPLLVAIDDTPPLLAAGLGWITGTIGGVGVCGYWMWCAAIAYFGLTPAVAAAFTVAVVQVFVAPFFALFAGCAAMVGHQRWRLVLVPAAFVASELARATLVGNAWELLGHSQRAAVLLQSTSVTGVYGLSFLLAMSATSIADLLRSTDRGVPAASRRAAAWTGVAVTALLTAAVMGFGVWRLEHPPAAPGTLDALLVQGDVSNEERARADRAPDVIARYVRLSASVEPVPPLVLWPENAIDVFPEANPALLAPIRGFAARTGSAVLTGAPRAGQRAGRAAIYNSAYLVTAAASGPVYDKRRLLPFVERFALRSADGPYLPGDRDAPVPVGAARVAVLICYEAIYPSLAADRLGAGANLLVNLSNDSWFDAGAGPAQHYELVRFRAVESGTALLRATNSGVSGAFDPNGRELAHLPRRVAGAVAVQVPLVARPSFYAQHGDWFAMLCVAVVVLWRAALPRGRSVAERERSGAPP